MGRIILTAGITVVVIFGILGCIRITVKEKLTGSTLLDGRLAGLAWDAIKTSDTKSWVSHLLGALADVRIGF